MPLLPIDGARVGLVASWLAEKANYQWLDFGRGAQALSEVALRVMLQRDIHLMRLYTADDGVTPIGVVALSDIDRVFRTGRLWYVLGDKRFAGRGLTSRAVADLVREGFGPVRLEAINAWAVVENRPSIRILESNGFRLIGYQRRCHRIDGRPVDRALFDLLASEFEGGLGVPRQCH